MKNQPQMVRVLVSRETSTEGTLWVAQLLEFDVAAQGVTWKKALMALAQAIADQIVVDTSLGRTPFAGVEPAPADVVNQFDAAMRSTEELPEVPPAKRRKATRPSVAPAWMRAKTNEVRVS